MELSINHPLGGIHDTDTPLPLIVTAEFLLGGSLKPTSLLETPPHELSMWGKVLSVVLAVLGATQCAAERDAETLTHDQVTMGKSGPSCTRQGRKCLFNATCHDHRCSCPDGQTGQAEIECVAADERLCYIAGDPHIRGFSKAKATVALPCRFRATRFLTDNVAAVTDAGHCSIEVFATPELLAGRYVVRSVHVSVGISDMALNTHSYSEIYKTVTYDVNDTEVYSYQARSTHRDSFWGTQDSDVAGVSVYPDYDDVNNFVTIEIPACQTRIKYRAFDRFRAKHQKQLPGLTIMAPKHATWVDGFGDHPNSACGQPQDSRTLYKDRSDALGLRDADAGLVYDILNNSPDQTDNRVANKCQRSFLLFRSSNDKVLDVNECAFLVTSPRVGLCIQEKAARQPFDAFIGCMALRQDKTFRCRLLRRTARFCQNMEDWTGPRADDIVCPTDLKGGDETTVPPVPESFVF